MNEIINENQQQIDFKTDDIEEKEKNNDLESNEIEKNEIVNDENIIEKKDINIEDKEYNNDDNDIDANELYNYLKDYGIAPELDEEEKVEFKTLDDVANFIYENQQKLIEERVREELETYPQTYKDLFEYVRKGGNIEDFVQSYKNNYSDINYSEVKQNKTLQDKILHDYYKTTTQWNDDFIRRHLEKFSDDEKEEMSKTALAGLKKYEEQQREQLLEQQRIAEQQQLEYKKQLVNYYEQEIEKIDKIGDLDVTPKDKDEIREYLFNDITYNKITQNFDKYRLSLAILDKYGLLDDPTKLTKIVKSSKKKYNFKKNSTNNQHDINSIDDFEIELKMPDNEDGKIDLII